MVKSIARWSSGDIVVEVGVTGDGVGVNVVRSFYSFERRYSSSSSGECRSCSLTQLFSDAGYPSHLTRYCLFRVRLLCLSLMISSTSYSSSPSINCGGGCGKLAPCSFVS